MVCVFLLLVGILCLSFAIIADILHAVSLFDESYHPSAEKMDFVLRVRKVSFKIAYLEMTRKNNAHANKDKM